MKELLIIFVVLMSASCKPKSELLFSEEMLAAVPDSILSAQKMADVLTDIHLAESAILEIKSDSVRERRNLIIGEYYADIMSLHNVSFSDFLNSYEYYTQHPLLMNYIYKMVTDNLSLLESKIE
ncbi:MAG: DUF4296 domain-containing protein [Chitinophagales bacterium]